MEIYQKKIEDVLKDLKTDTIGLSNKESERRIKKYGSCPFSEVS